MFQNELHRVTKVDDHQKGGNKTGRCPKNEKEVVVRRISPKSRDMEVSDTFKEV